MKYFCIHISQLGPNPDCLATKPNVRPTSSVGDMLLRKFNVATSFKADVIDRSVNKTQAMRCTVARCYVNISKLHPIAIRVQSEIVFAFT